MASTYGTQDWHQHLERTVSSALLARHSWLGLSEARSEAGANSARGKRLLDYACGPGMVTRTLAPYVDFAVGVDVSERMVERYRELAGSLKLQEVEGIVGNLVDGEEERARKGEEESVSATNIGDSSALGALRDFDVAVVGLGFHHFDDPMRAAKALASRLREKGGVLLVVDFIGGCGSKADHQKKAEVTAKKDEANDVDEHSRIPKAMHATVRVHGFDRTGMQEIFTAAGLKDFEWDEIDEEVKLIVDGETKRRKVFLARGVKY